MPDRELLVRIVGDDRDLQKALGSTDRRLKQIDDRTAAFGKNLRTAFASAGIAVGISTITFGLRDIAQASIDFEEAFAGVRKTVDASEAEFAVLSAGIRELSKDIPITVVELARIAEAAGQLGIAKRDILDFTRTVANLAATTNLSSDQAADAFARLTNITGLPQSQIENLGSAVVDLGNKLAATESEIVEFSVRIAGAGKQAGLTDAQIVSIAAAFRSVGVEAEAGGTAVQKVLLSMTSAVLSGGKQLEQFARVSGQSVAQFRDTFGADSGAAFLSFVQGLEAVREEGGNVFKVLEGLGFTDQRLVRAFLAMSSNSQLLADSLDIGSRAFEENIALVEEAEKRYETTASRIQIFENVANDLAITIGDELVASLEDAVGAAELLHDALEALEDLAPIEIPIEIPVTLFVAGRSVGGARDLFSKVGEEIGDSLEALVAGGQESIDNLKRLFSGQPGRPGFSLFPSPVDDAVTQALDDTRKSADETEDAAQEVRTVEDRRRRAFDAFIKGMGLKLDKAQLTKGLEDDLAALRELEAAIFRRIAREGRTFKLIDLLTQTRADIARLVEQQAEDARQAGEDAFNATLDALNLNLERAEDSPGLRDDIAALRAIEQAILNRIASEGETTDLLRQLLQVRQEQKEVAKRLADQRRFEALGLTAEGEERVPGIGALRRRGRGLIEELQASGLDEATVAKYVDRISDIFTTEFDGAGRKIRQAILQLFQTINQTLDQGTKQGPLTKTSGLNTKKILAGLGLSPEEINALRGRLSGFNTAGRALAGIQAGAGPSSNVLAGAGLGGGAGRIVVESHTTINLDGQKVANVVTRNQQKARRRNPKQKRGPNRNR
jgi:TP901 family phage tail tape measure protein